RADGFAFVGVAKPLVPAPRFGTGHAQITPAARAAEEDRRGHPQCWRRRGGFADAVAAEWVGVIGGQLGPTVTDDLALFAESAGDDVHLSPAGDVMGDGGAVGDGLVVRMGVHEQQPWDLLHAGTIPVWRRQRTRNPVGRSANRWISKAHVSPKETPMATINACHSRPLALAAGASNSRTRSTTRRWPNLLPSATAGLPWKGSLREPGPARPRCIVAGPASTTWSRRRCITRCRHCQSPAPTDQRGRICWPSSPRTAMYFPARRRSPAWPS